MLKLFQNRCLFALVSNKNSHCHPLIPYLSINFFSASKVFTEINYPLVCTRHFVHRLLILFKKSHKVESILVIDKYRRKIQILIRFKL